MAKCAREIIQQNGFGNKIRLIPKRSTDITVGRGNNIRSFYVTYILFLTSFHVLQRYIYILVPILMCIIMIFI